MAATGTGLARGAIGLAVGLPGEPVISGGAP